MWDHVNESMKVPFYDNEAPIIASLDNLSVVSNSIYAHAYIFRNKSLYYYRLKFLNDK